MSTIKTSGLVLRSIKYRETSLIVDIYTKERGLRSYIVNGVRKPKARMNASLFQHGNLVEMVAYDGDGGKLLRIKEIGLETPYAHIPFDVEKSSIALFLLEVIRNSIKEQESNPSLFEFLTEWLLFLDTYKGSHALIHIKFLCDYATFIGFKPINDWSVDRPYFNLELGHFTDEFTRSIYVTQKEGSKAISTLLEIDKQDLHSLYFRKDIRMEIIDDLIKFYKLHIDSFKDLKSFDILKQIF